MTDNTTLPIPGGSTTGDTIRSIDRTVFKTQVVQLDIGGAGAESLVTGAMPVSGTVTVGNASLAVTGTFWQATQPVSIAATVAVSGPLTDAQLRATAVPVSLTSTTITGTVAATQSGTWTIQPGNTANTTPWLIRPSDGTNNVAVKAASTAAAATDPALVVAVSPNNTLPANITQINGVARLTGNGVTGTGSPRVTIASDNTPFTVNTTPTTPTASIINSAATTNATSVKASAGTIYSISASNVGAAAAFLKIYNLATAPTVGTSTIALTIPIAASGVVNLNFGPQGMRFGTGIALAITNLVADADATAIAAGQVKVLTSYI